uniref:Urotensin-related peptide 1 n=1 Tax=Takifugu rubripes TaxID=31033 RepID=A0A3B5K923_TAKRU
MLSLAVFYLVAVICSAKWTQALPLYPDTIMETDLYHKLMSEVEEGPDAADGGQSQVKNLYPLLMQQNMGRDSWDKGRGNKKYSDIRQTQHAQEAVLKLAAADKLRSQGFHRSEQNLPKTNKRACFWKYCVTN